MIVNEIVAVDAYFYVPGDPTVPGPAKANWHHPMNTWLVYADEAGRLVDALLTGDGDVPDRISILSPEESPGMAPVPWEKSRLAKEGGE